MQIKPIKTKVFRENQDLLDFIFQYVKRLPEQSVLVVTSKIIALAEGSVRMVKNKKEKENLIKKESERAIKTKLTWLTLKDGMVLPAAGVDESNANGKIILLPKDSFKSAEMIRNAVKKKFKLKKIGVLVTDSRVFPLRAGVGGIALGYAGFIGIKDYRGTPDIFGRIMKISRTNLADSLATAAIIEMGEGREQQPLALITGAPLVFKEKVNKKELKIALKDDLFEPLFRGILEK